eukprot:scaffold12028_cov116-Amphora_coffeaeformis.AAC.2
MSSDHNLSLEEVSRLAVTKDLTTQEEGTTQDVPPKLMTLREFLAKYLDEPDCKNVISIAIRFSWVLSRSPTKILRNSNK